MYLFNFLGTTIIQILIIHCTNHLVTPPKPTNQKTPKSPTTLNPSTPHLPKQQISSNWFLLSLKVGLSSLSNKQFTSLKSGSTSNVLQSIYFSVRNCKDARIPGNQRPVHVRLAARGVREVSRHETRAPAGGARPPGSLRRRRGSRWAGRGHQHRRVGRAAGTGRRGAATELAAASHSSRWAGRGQLRGHFGSGRAGRGHRHRPAGRAAGTGRRGAATGFAVASRSSRWAGRAAGTGRRGRGHRLRAPSSRRGARPTEIERVPASLRPPGTNHARRKEPGEAVMQNTEGMGGLLLPQLLRVQPQPGEEEGARRGGDAEHGGDVPLLRVDADHGGDVLLP